MRSIDIPAFGWKPRDYQRPAWESWLNGCSRQLLIWHRRAGKDEINLEQHAVGAFNRVGTYWHMLPEYAQARKAIWTAINPHTGRRRIDEAFPHEIRANTNEQEMFIRFVNGSTWQAVGSDRYDSLVGSPPIGITASEWALANPTAWAYLAPILAENGGWASFISTPRGNNHLRAMYDQFKDDPGWFVEILRASQTGAATPEAIEETRKTYASLFGQEMADMLIDQEYECSFAGAMIGSYFGPQMNAAEVEGRVRPLPIDRAHPVHTAWDLGKAVNNPIWCFQVIAGQLRIVDFYIPESDDLDDWIDWLEARGYDGTDYVPHDILAGEWASSRTRTERLRARRKKVQRIPRVSVADGLQAGRMSIKDAVFHDDDDERGERVEAGRDGLKAYRREWDDERKTFRDNPVKDWAEHIGSAWRYLSLAWREVVPPQLVKPKPKELEYVAGPHGSSRANMSVRDAVAAMQRRKRDG